jgi:polyisoprenoid-binding protein YceI
MKTLNIKTADSTALWTGKKLAGKHTGTINFKSGSLSMDDGQITEGLFEINMDSISVTDLTGDAKDQLEGHLKSDDFFATNTFPTATLEIIESTKLDDTHKVTAHVTIKSITHPIKFDLVIQKNQAHTTLIIDRSKYDVKFGSKSFFKSLGDNLIYDNFELEVTLSF